MSVPKHLSEKQRAILFDAPLSRDPWCQNWIGRRERHWRDSVTRLIDRNLLAIDIENDRTGRTAIITEAGRQALLGA